MMAQKTDNLLRSWEYSLRAQGKSPHTLRQYLGSAQRFLTWLGKPPHEATRYDVERWLTELSQRTAPATVAHRYSGLRAFYRWLEEEDEIDSNPMARVKKPRVPETTKDVVSPELIAVVLKDLHRAKRYRDEAIIALFYDTGMRASEVANIRVDDVDLDEGLITLPYTKNREVRVVPISPSTVTRINRWLRRRRDPQSPWLFTGQRGRHLGCQLTRSGLAQLVVEAFAPHTEARITPHDLRHTFATHFMEDEGARTEDLMTIAGWKTDAMARRYTKTRRLARAIQAHRRLSPMSRLGV